MKKVLIVKGSAIGDVVQCLAFASALKTTLDHDIELHWLVSKKCRSLLENNKFIDKILCIEDYKDSVFRITKRIYNQRHTLNGLDWLLKFSSAINLQNEQYDIVVNLHHKVDSKMLSIISNPQKLITAPFLEAEDNLLYNGNKHRLIDYLQVVELINNQFDANTFAETDIDYGWYFTKDEISKTSKLLYNYNLNGKPYIVLVLGTTWQSKNWPVENWIELTKLLVQSNKKIVLQKAFFQKRH